MQSSGAAVGHHMRMNDDRSRIRSTTTDFRRMPARRIRRRLPTLTFASCLIVAGWACGPPADQQAAVFEENGGRAAELVAAGRERWASRRPDDLIAARELFQQAIGLDPDLAGAWSGLADASALLGLYSVLPAPEVMPEALHAADRALALDPDNAATHASRGLALYLHDWDFSAAEESFRHALELDANQVNAHHWYGMMLSVLGRHDEALEHMRAAAQGTTSALLATKIGTLQLTAGRLEAARSTLHEAAARHPDSRLPNRELGYVELAAGRPAEAVGHFVEALRIGTSEPAHGTVTTSQLLESGDPKLLVALALSLERSGLGLDNDLTVVRTDGSTSRVTTAAAVIDAIRRRAATKPLSPVTAARLELVAGAPDEALAWLQRAVEVRDPGLVYLRTKPSFEDLADHPDFLELCRRIGI